MNKSLYSTCPRCGGAMIYDKFYGHTEDFWGFKCLICGEIIDPVILENRELMRLGLGVSLPRKPHMNGGLSPEQGIRP